MRAVLEDARAALESGHNRRRAALLSGLTESPFYALKEAMGPAWGDGGKRRLSRKEPLVEGLIAYLAHQGHLPEDAADQERACVAAYRYLKYRNAMPGANYRRARGNSVFPRCEQARLAHEYVALRRGGATDDEAGAWLLRTGITCSTIKRWVDRHIAPRALQVGRCRDGHLHQRILEALAEAGPLDRRQLAARLEVNHNTLSSALRRLRLAGQVVSQASRPYQLWYKA